MIRRVVLALEQSEYSALLKLAVEELRNPPDQAHHILRQELSRRGLLTSDHSEDEVQPTGEAAITKGGEHGNE